MLPLEALSTLQTLKVLQLTGDVQSHKQTMAPRGLVLAGSLRVLPCSITQLQLQACELVGVSDLGSVDLDIENVKHLNKLRSLNLDYT